MKGDIKTDKQDQTNNNEEEVLNEKERALLNNLDHLLSKRPLFPNSSTHLYEKVIEIYFKYNDKNELYVYEPYLDCIYATLTAWGMDSLTHKANNRNKPILYEFKTFKNSIIENREILLKLSNKKIEELSKDELKSVVSELGYLFINLKIMKSESKIVGVSKTLHFLLPELVVPIDRTHTLKFFGKNINKKNGDKVENELKVFTELFDEFHNIATTGKEILKRKIDKDDAWSRTIPKLIDNAIINYIREEKGKGGLAEHVRDSPQS